MPRPAPLLALAPLVLAACMSDPATGPAGPELSAQLLRADMSTTATEVIFTDGRTCTLPHRRALRPGSSWNGTIANCPFTHYQITLMAEPPSDALLIAPVGTAPLYPDLGLPFGWASLWLSTEDDGPWILEGAPMMLHSDGGPG